MIGYTSERNTSYQGSYPTLLCQTEIRPDAGLCDVLDVYGLLKSREQWRETTQARVLYQFLRIISTKEPAFLWAGDAVSKLLVCLTDPTRERTVKFNIVCVSHYSVCGVYRERRV